MTAQAMNKNDTYASQRGCIGELERDSLGYDRVCTLQQDLGVDGMRAVRHISSYSISLAMLRRRVGHGKPLHKESIVEELEKRTTNRKRLQMSLPT